MGWSVAEMPHAGEHHRDAVLVGRGDDLLVAHAAAGLDHRGGAGVGDHVEAVAEREEGVRGDDRAGAA